MMDGVNSNIILPPQLWEGAHLRTPPTHTGQTPAKHDSPASLQDPTLTLGPCKEQQGCQAQDQGAQ